MLAAALAGAVCAQGRSAASGGGRPPVSGLRLPGAARRSATPARRLAAPGGLARAAGRRTSRDAERAFVDGAQAAAGVLPGDGRARATPARARRIPGGAGAFRCGALSRRRGMRPALAGRGEALIAAGERDAALESFEAALAADPRLGDLGRRDRRRCSFDARQGTASPRPRRPPSRPPRRGARRRTQRAIAASPDSAFLHRDLGLVELRAGTARRPNASLRKALALDPADVRAWTASATALERPGELAEAIAALRARAWRSSRATRSNGDLARLRERAETQRLPPEYAGHPGGGADHPRRPGRAGRRPRSRRCWRRRPPGVVVITDVRGHWASPLDSRSIARGPDGRLPNHTFQPRGRRAPRRTSRRRRAACWRLLPPSPARAGRSRVRMADVAADAPELSEPSPRPWPPACMPLLDGGASGPSRAGERGGGGGRRRPPRAAGRRGPRPGSHGVDRCTLTLANQLTLLRMLLDSGLRDSRRLRTQGWALLSS